MTKRLKTNIKFKKNTKTGQFFGFVTKSGSSWRGCGENSDCKKRIVFADKALSDEMVDGALYHATLVPMKSGEGFIAISAKLVKFSAKIETSISDNVFRVSVRFGNRCLTYEPGSKDKRMNSITKIADRIRERVDLENTESVVSDFLEAATIVLAYYKEAA